MCVCACVRVLFDNPNDEGFDTRKPRCARLSCNGACACVAGADAGGDNPLAQRLLGPVETGCLGILPLGPDMLTTLVLSYAHQLNHPNPLTRASAKWGLMWALWRFNPDMPCVHGGLTDCDCHPTDHNRFLRYT